LELGREDETQPKQTKDILWCQTPRLWFISPVDTVNNLIPLSVTAVMEEEVGGCSRGPEVWPTANIGEKSWPSSLVKLLPASLLGTWQRP